jgi:hypothetical protein
MTGITTQESASWAERTATPNAPIIILSYACSGFDLLSKALSASSALACTQMTGVLPLCHSALATWQQMEDRPGGPSALAIKSVRTLIGTMLAVTYSAAGAARWCETSFAPPDAAASFLRIFPAATFLCLHRGLPGVVADASAAYPWGLGNSPFWPYSGTHPGNNAATIAAYWVAKSRSLLEFQASHPQSCLRVSHDQLAAGSHEQSERIFIRLGLDTRDLAVPRSPHDHAGEELAASVRTEIPLDRLPVPLLNNINEINAELGLPGLSGG